VPEKVSKAQLRAWIQGHQTADARRIRRLSVMSPDEKLREMSRLMASAGLFDFSRREAGDQAVRDLWQTLRARAQR